MSGKLNQKRSETLIKKVETNTESLIQRLTNMIALSASTSAQEVQASEMLQIEYSASMIVRLVEELLSVSRTLKENWILGQLPKPDEDGEQDITAGIEDKMNEVLKKILQTKQFDEEIGDDDIEEDEDEEEEEDEEETDDIPQVKEEVIPSLEALVPEIVVAQPSPAIKSEPAPVKLEPSIPAPEQQASSSSAQPAQSAQPTQSTEVKTQPAPAQPSAPKEQPVTIPDTIDMTDTANMLGDYDFDNFGTMDEDHENDIIMID